MTKSGELRSEMLTALFKNMSEGVCVHEVIYENDVPTDYRIVDVNPSFERLTGLTREQAVGCRASALYGTGEAPFLAEYSRVARTGEPICLQVFWPPMEKHFQISVISPREGQFATVFSDVSEIKTAEERARKSEEKYRGLFNQFPVGLLRLEAGSEVVLECNELAASMLGYPNPAACAESFSSEQHLPQAEELERLRGVLREQGQFRNVEVQLHRSDGEPIWASISARLFDALGYFELALFDVTERRKLQDRLRQSEKLSAIGELAGGVAHDFNNQLAGIVGFADLIESAPTADPEIRRYAESIRIAGERAASLTQQLLAFARKGRYRAVPVNVNQIVDEVISLMAHTVDRRIRIVGDLSRGVPTILGDPAQIQNALMNLAINARDAMSEGGTLIISTDIAALSEAECNRKGGDMKPGRYVLVDVSDTGCGMDETVLKRAFDPFFTTKAEGKGTGMGLAAVYGTVRGHNGTVELVSEKGRGTTVHLCFPYLERNEETLLEPAASVSPRGVEGACVLVVDDEPLLAELAVEILSRSGIRCMTASDGKEAVALYARDWSRIDAIVLDMIMPEMNGRDTFRALREINPCAEVLLSSGYAIDDETQQLIQEGAAGFLQKPFRRKELVGCVEDILLRVPDRRS